MAIHLIVDGYNLIRQSPLFSRQEEFSLEQGRKVLLEYLFAYKKIKKHRITVVFDAAYEPTYTEEAHREKSIKVIFSRKGQTADDVIKRLAHKEGERAIVVTSDRDLANAAEHSGAVSVSSPEFEATLMMASMGEKEVEPEEDESSSSRFMTRKKGPSKKLSKKERKSRSKISKL